MAWLSSTTAIEVSRTEYPEERTDPDNPDVTQARMHVVFVVEYRGLTYDAAYALVNGQGSISALTKVSLSMSPIGGGGWIVSKETDYVPDSTWQTYA